MPRHLTIATNTKIHIDACNGQHHMLSPKRQAFYSIRQQCAHLLVQKTSYMALRKNNWIYTYKEYIIQDTCACNHERDADSLVPAT